MRAKDNNGTLFRLSASAPDGRAEESTNEEENGAEY